MTRMSGRSKHPPKSEARPLGTAKPKKANHADAARLKIAERAKRDEERQVSIVDPVVFDQSHGLPLVSENNTLPSVSDVVDFPHSPAVQPVTVLGYTMNLTLKGISKNGKRALYTGAAQVITIPVGAFLDKTVPQTIDIADVFAPMKTPKAKMTPEEKAAAKLARKNAPKPTIAERARKAQERADKLAKQAAAAL